MRLTDKQQEYWHKNLKVTALLLTLWFLVTFMTSYFARELNGISLLGFPMGFYMSAQGSLIVYVAITWYYAHYMNKLDVEYGVDEDADE